MTFCHLSGSSSLMFSVKLRKFLYENAFDEIFHPVSIRDMCFAATEKCYQSAARVGQTIRVQEFCFVLFLQYVGFHFHGGEYFFLLMSKTSNKYFHYTTTQTCN